MGMVSIEEASWPAAEMGTPAACAPRKIRVRDLIEYIDWSPFFHAWELRGRYPAIFDDPKIGKQARELFDDAQELLERIVSEKSTGARGVYAFWPANTVGDDVDVYADEARTEKLATFYFLRQQMQKPAGTIQSLPGGLHCAEIGSRIEIRPQQEIISADSRSPFTARTSSQRSSSVSTTITARS